MDEQIVDELIQSICGEVPAKSDVTKMEYLSLLVATNLSDTTRTGAGVSSAASPAGIREDEAKLHSEIESRFDGKSVLPLAEVREEMVIRLRRQLIAESRRKRNSGGSKAVMVDYLFGSLDTGNKGFLDFKDIQSAVEELKEREECVDTDTTDDDGVVLQEDDVTTLTQHDRQQKSTTTTTTFNQTLKLFQALDPMVENKISRGNFDTAVYPQL